MHSCAQGRLPPLSQTNPVNGPWWEAQMRTCTTWQLYEKNVRIAKDVIFFSLFIHLYPFLPVGS